MRTSICILAITLAILGISSPLLGPSSSAVELPCLSRSGPRAAQYGMWQLELPTRDVPRDPLADSRVEVTFTQPDGEQIRVEAFCRGLADGSPKWIARAYCRSLDTCCFQKGDSSKLWMGARISLKTCNPASEVSQLPGLTAATINLTVTCSPPCSCSIRK